MLQGNRVNDGKAGDYLKVRAPRLLILSSPLVFSLVTPAFGLVLLRHKFCRATFAGTAAQHGQRGRCATRATISRRLSVAIE
jgi:hypothetical protein